ncbi:MAG: M28 family metallopeptidase [Anaerolineae bacterium]|nr:M28 family metallopeptidase [Anaerolineae bacterium]
MIVALIAAALIGPVGCRSASIALPDRPTPLPLPESTPAGVATPQQHVTPYPPAPSPYDMISAESLLSFLEELTAIQPYSGWRNSATEGEAEALDLLARKLEEFEYLQSLGMALERQHFRVFLATELWETRLYLTIDGEEVEVPASGIRGEREDIGRALWFDSDGQLNDKARDPVVVEGEVLLAGAPEEVEALTRMEVRGRIVLVDYAAVDRSVRGQEAVQTAQRLLSLAPAGVVLVTRFSNRSGESHGTFAGEGGALAQASRETNIPILYVRLEDLAGAGITEWRDLARVASARLVWDADVLSPAPSGNLVARIPGLDQTRAVILGAHVDSPNSPGALDDGSGTAILLEVARVLDAARLQPSIDLYLVWFGSEELGLYGSYHFVATHQELLDRTLGMLQVDMLSYPLEGVAAKLNLVSWPYDRQGENRLPWAEYLAAVAERLGIQAAPLGHYGLESDNAAFTGFNVPNANLMYADHGVGTLGKIHYASHIHDPYDTVELAREQRDVFVQMAQIALSAALEAAGAEPLRAAPRPTYRLLFVGSHTEPVHISPAVFMDFGLTMAGESFDVDMIPYGHAVLPSDLEDADLVIVLPVLDYPTPEGDVTVYDESWSAEEIAVLKDYVAAGGLLVLTNGAQRLKYFNRPLDFNEDWSDINPLAEQFGLAYFGGNEGTPVGRIELRKQHPLMRGVDSLELADGNTVLFTTTRATEAAQVLAQTRRGLVAALVDYGAQGGEVLALADVGLLNTSGGESANLPFWRNLARYARLRAKR